MCKNIVKDLKKNKHKISPYLILIAHGSKDPSWCKPFKRILNKLRKELPRNTIKLAYTELANPSLNKVVKNLIRKKVKYIKLLPLFMSAGSHINRDIKGFILKVKKNLPKLKVEVLPPIGKHPKIGLLICEIIKEYLC